MYSGSVGRPACGSVNTQFHVIKPAAPPKTAAIRILARNDALGIVLKRDEIQLDTTSKRCWRLGQRANDVSSEIFRVHVADDAKVLPLGTVRHEELNDWRTE